MKTPRQASLRTLSISAFLWGGGGSFLRLLLQIAAQVVLARIVGPEQYGLYAIGVLVLGVCVLLSDAGLAYGLVQLKQLDSSHIRFVFTWQLVIGLIVTSVLATLSGEMSEYFREPRMTAVICALAPIALIQAVSAVSLSLLKREMDFKSVQITQITAYFVGYLCVGIPLAMAGAQIWALVAAAVMQSLVSAVLLYRATLHPVKPLFRHTGAAGMSHFGLTVLATNLSNWLITNIDRTIVARSLSSIAVGLYANAYNFVNTPSTILAGFIQPVMYSACAKMQGDPKRIRKAYLMLVSGIALVLMPAYLLVSVISETMILALYGQAWQPAAEVLCPIALAMPTFLLWSITTPVLWNAGRVTLEFKLQFPLAALWLTGALLAVQYSLAALAWTVCGLFLIRMMMFTQIAMRLLDIRLSDYLQALRGGLTLGMLVVIAAWITEHLLTHLAVDPVFKLLAVITLSGLAILIALKFLPSLIAPSLMEILVPGLGRLPVGAARFVGWLLATQLDYRRS